MLSRHSAPLPADPGLALGQSRGHGQGLRVAKLALPQNLAVRLGGPGTPLFLSEMAGREPSGQNPALQPGEAPAPGLLLPPRGRLNIARTAPGPALRLPSPAPTSAVGVPALQRQLTLRPLRSHPFVYGVSLWGHFYGGHEGIYSPSSSPTLGTTVQPESGCEFFHLFELRVLMSWFTLIPCQPHSLYLRSP